MFANIQKVKHREFLLTAQMHGLKIKDVDLDNNNESENVPLFGDPEEYKNLSDEEKENMTAKMMSKHKSWSGEKLSKG